jgi:hypothetical protein
MTFSDFATYLAHRIRTEGVDSFAVVVGLHLAAIAWPAVRAGHRDSHIRWDLAAIASLSVLDHIDPPPRSSSAVTVGARHNGPSAPALSDLLAAIALVFGHSPSLNGMGTWRHDAERRLRAAIELLH